MNGRKTKALAAIILVAGLTFSGCGNFKNTEKEPEKKTEEKSEQPSSEKLTGEQTKVTEATTELPTQEVTEPPTQTPTVDVNNLEKIAFPKSAFLGDSRTAGLNEKGVVSEADFYTSIGTTVKDVVEKENFQLQNGSYGTMLDAVSEKEYDKLYLMFGINELGWPYKESFVRYYTNIVNTLKTRYPNAEIYIQSILPMVEKRTDEIYNNDKIRLFNTYIQEVASNTGVHYIDVGVSVQDETGALPEEASNDGVHLKKEYCFKWAKYLKEQTQN